MATVEAEVSASWFLSSGAVTFFIVVLIVLLILSIYLTALCSECSRRSFDLRDPEADKDPSSLIRVVKLEDAMVARENPMISEIQKDEKEFNPSEGSTVSFTPWRSHLGAPQNQQNVQTNGSAAVMKTGSDSETAAESNPEEENSVSFPPWRSHLVAPQDQDLNHIYHTIGGGGGGGQISGDGEVSSPPLTNQEPSTRSAAEGNSVYARVSKKMRPATPPAHTPEEVQVEEEEEEESSPPLPHRKTQLEG